MARHAATRLLLALSAKHKLLVNHIDVVSAYLNGELEEEIFMEQPPMFVSETHPNKVCRLKKSLYGLKQAGRYWNKKINSLLNDMGFRRCKTDNCIYFMNYQNEINIISIYVDDLIIACSEEATMKNIIEKLCSQVEAVDRGPIKYYVGLEIQRDGLRGEFKIHQQRYTLELLTKWGMLDCKGAATPSAEGSILEKCGDERCSGSNVKEFQSLLGGLTYLATMSRPDIMHIVSRLAQYHSHPHQEHFVAAKRVLRYLKLKPKGMLTYVPNNENLVCFTDADWGSDPVDRKSLSGFALFFCGCLIAGESKKQPIVSLSTMEAEYIAMCQGVKEVAFHRSLLKEVVFNEYAEMASAVMCDNQGAQFAVKNPIVHKRSKHIDIRFHYIREKYVSGEIDIQYVPSSENAADIFTKILSLKKHELACMMLKIIFV